jgi:hypothetical protein
MGSEKEDKRERQRLRLSRRRYMKNEEEAGSRRNRRRYVKNEEEDGSRVEVGRRRAGRKYSKWGGPKRR